MALNNSIARFTLQQLNIFVAVVDSGSFSAAARRLGKAQSAISNAVANLEIDLGTPLFERTGHVPTLTEAGRHLIVDAQAVLMRCRSLEEHAHAFAAHTETELVLALDNAVPLATITEALATWQAAFPTVTLRVTHPTMRQVSQLLLDGEADIALMLVQSDYPKDVAFCRVGQVRMVEIAQAQHPLGAAREVTFADLSEYRQLVFAPHGCAIATSEYVISPRYYITESYFTLLDMVRQGLGWAMVPYSLVASELNSGRLKEINMAAYPFTDWIVGVDLLWCRTRRLGSAGNNLRRHLTTTRIAASDAK